NIVIAFLKRSVFMKRLSVSFVVATLVYALSFMPAWAKGEDSCSKSCSKCHDTCVKTLAEFEKKGGKYADPARINLIKDCIKICELNADFARRKSANAAASDKLCAEICRKCAASCAELKDKSLDACVKECNDCSSCCESESK